MTGVGIHVGKSVDPTFLRGEGLGTIVRTDAEVAGERGGRWWWGGESGWWEGWERCERWRWRWQRW